MTCRSSHWLVPSAVTRQRDNVRITARTVHVLLLTFKRTLTRGIQSPADQTNKRPACKQPNNTHTHKRAWTHQLASGYSSLPEMNKWRLYRFPLVHARSNPVRLLPGIQILVCNSLCSDRTGYKDGGKKQLEDRPSQEAGLIGNQTCHYRSGTVVLQSSSSLVHS